MKIVNWLYELLVDWWGGIRDIDFLFFTFLGIFIGMHL